MFYRPLLSFYAPKLRVSTAGFLFALVTCEEDGDFETFFFWRFHGYLEKTWQVANFCKHLGETIIGGKLKLELFFHGPKWLFVMTDYFIVWEGSLDISHSLKPPKINGLEGTT